MGYINIEFNPRRNQLASLINYDRDILLTDLDIFNNYECRYDSRRVEIKKIYIDSTKKNRIKFCLVQLDYDLECLYTPEYMWTICQQDAIKIKIFEAIKIANQENVDIICFPELSFLYEWEIKVAKLYRDMIIIGGSFYKGNFNIASIIIHGNIYYYKKCLPSIWEKSLSGNCGMVCGDIIPIYQTSCGRFCVLTCCDYYKYVQQVSEWKDDNDGMGIDFIINPCCDDNIKRFQSRLSTDADMYDICIFQINRANKDGKYGQSSIFAKEHVGIIEGLIKLGYRKKDDGEYCLYLASGEVMAIFEINIRSNKFGIPLNYKERIGNLNEWIFDANDGLWCRKE